MTLAAAGASIDIQAVSKHYRDCTAVDDVSLHIQAGEFLTLLGASGSGKSTLLNVIAGFTEPSAGRIDVGGKDLTTVPPHRRDLGMVFQHYALFPHLTVWDNVAFPLRRRKVNKQQLNERVRQALEVVELGHLAKRRPAELSGGQQQRVALARAIVFRPRALLMDEPLGALDKRLREQLQLEIKRLHEELGTTFVFVTHDQEEALAMSDRIAVLRDGALVQVGTPRELYERPANLYTAQFLGESNILAGDKPGTSLVVRPEHLQFCASDVPEGHSALSGTVREVVYLGSGLRVEVALPDGRVLIARPPARGPVTPQPGADVVVHWHPEHCVVVEGGDSR